MIGKQFVYETITDRLGSDAEAWLDKPHRDLILSHQVESETPREALESGCPACIDTVYQIAKKL